jgi:hypothetical protein
MERPNKARPNKSPLKEIVHYICKRMALQPEKLGAVKLQKIVWYFDVRSYGLTGQVVSGAKFVKGRYGPFTRDLSGAVLTLVSEGRLFADTTDYFENEKARFIGKGTTDETLFNERQLRWLDEIITDVCENHTADSISERSHGLVWRMARLGEEIPFAATVVSLKRPSKEAVELAREDLSSAE